jgi:dTMP kinase
MIHQHPGRLIAIEGTNLAGKSVFIADLLVYLSNQGLSVVPTCEPGGTAFGNYLRQGLKSSEGVCDFARALAMNASRAHKQVAITLPALEEGKIVLTDRYSTSTRVFQEELGHLDAEQYDIVERIHRSLVQPDLTIYLLPDLDLLRTRQASSERAVEKDVFEKNIADELAAYERVLQRELADGQCITVLRFDAQTQDSLLPMLAADVNFQSIFWNSPLK